jgi:hypothetical protein
MPVPNQTTPSTVAIQRELDRVLRSPPFRESKRCQEFLRFVVGMTADGRQAELKERTIGIAVFGRDPAYDTNDDSIVRVKANEIRRRLAQSNQGNDHEQEFKIEIPTGSYVPKFVPAHEISAPAKPEMALKKPEMALKWIRHQIESAPPRWKAGIAVVLLLAVGAMVWSLRDNGDTVTNRFWAPILQSESPVLISLGHPVVYHLSRRIHEQYRAGLTELPDPGPYAIRLDPKQALGEDIIPVVDQYVGIGDALAAVSISSLLRQFGKASSVRIGNDVSYSELRNSTAVLIGAYSNRWTLELTKQLRFTFEMKEGRKVIQDRQNPQAGWELPNLPSTGKVPFDYAIVSRIFDSKTGNTLISCAGITQYGSQAAGEFLTDPARLSGGLSSLQAGRGHRNIQFVIRTEVVGSSPAPPVLVAAHSW